MKENDILQAQDVRFRYDTEQPNFAEAEGVHEESIRQSIKRGLERMKKTF